MIFRLCNPLNSDSFFLFGARGVGKSTFIKEQFLASDPAETIWTIDLLHDDTFDRYSQRPSRIEEDLSALPVEPTWVFIDEIQRVPALLNHVHRLIENRKQKFILTGSSARKLKKVGSNLLAGRAFLNNLFPLSFLETKTSFQLLDVLHWGSLPKVVNSKSDQKAAFLKSYVQVYIKEEILIEQLIRELEPFRNFLEVAAQMNGKTLNYARISREVGVDPKTIENYYSILEDTYLGFLLPAFHRSVRKQQILHSKFFFFDIGVKRALDRSLNDTFSEGSSAYGHSFEHLVILEIYRLNQYFQSDYKLSHLRNKEGKEIDLILTRSRTTIVIEIKSYDRVSEDDVIQFNVLADSIKGGQKYLLSRDPVASIIKGVRCFQWQTGIKEIFGQK